MKLKRWIRIIKRNRKHRVEEEEKKIQRVVKKARFDQRQILIGVGLLVCILAIFNLRHSLLLGFVFFYGFSYYLIRKNGNQHQWARLVEGMAGEMDLVTRDLIFNLPVPFSLVSENGSILWYNEVFQTTMEGHEWIGESIGKIIPNFSFSLFEKESVEVSLGEQTYQVMCNVIEPKDDKSTRLAMLYWIRRTELADLKERLVMSQPCIAMIQIDNYAELASRREEFKMSEIDTAVHRILDGYSARMSAALREYDDGKYMMVLNYRQLNWLMERKFELLDEIREVNVGNSMPVTLSMGIGTGSDSFTKVYEYAGVAMEIALGRGGDQAVVKQADILNFYGGKSKTLEKRNRVKARVIAHALKELITESERVFIMGHKVPDMDALGAGVGFLAIVQNLDKKGYIVFEESNPSVDNLMQRLLAEDEEYSKNFLTPAQAEELFQPNDLLVVVDNHRPDSSEAPNLIPKAQKLILFDHHRRTASFIEPVTLMYMEPYASSTCELITEVISYMGDAMKLLPYEADSLLAGITVDTKNFTYKTGVRTFEAASYLRRAGADTMEVRKLFKDDLSILVQKASVLKEAEIYKSYFALSQFDQDSDISILVAAQSADELLKVRGVRASFVVTNYGGRIHISARSMDEINVQMIMEKLGGGGHMNSAATQIDTSLALAKNMLKQAIDEYIEEEKE
ncbi:DHH family phosphoesterase [Gottschalkiaceae bacterium SANA]|nr:DHH family phosphoesterase [Gottschalkiaceae bacterium SANA]